MVWLACLLAAIPGCSVFKKKPQRKYVFLLTLDTQRADFISAYSPQKAQTPNIDSFAAQGTLYENAYSLIPITGPAHAALFYSMPPHELKLYNNGQVFTPPDNVISLAEIFQRKGYKTAAFISLGVLQAKFQLNQGFSEYYDRLDDRRWYLNAGEINQKVFSWLEKNLTERFFVWLHYSDPHDPYAAPDLPPDLRIWVNGNIVRELCVQNQEKFQVTCPLRTGSNHIRLEILNPFPTARDDFRISLNDIEFLDPQPQSLPLKFEFTNITFISRGEKRSLALKKDGFIHIQNPGGKNDLVIKAQGNINLFPSERIQAYRREVEYLDQQIGVLKAKLAAMDLLEQSLLVFVGDHGEGLGEYITGFGADARAGSGDDTSSGEYYFGHIHYLEDVYMKVPLIFWDSSQADKGADRIKERVSLLDVTPTLMGMMGWEKQSFHAGRDLTKRKQPNHPTQSIFQATYSPEAVVDRFAALEYPWHLIYIPAQRHFDLFNLELDPQERKNLFAEYKDRPEWRGRILELQRQAAVILKNKLPFHIDERTREMLKSLGYIK